MQAALKLVLEPIFEADFAPCSYGFRPGRRTQDAIAETHLFASRSYEWVVDERHAPPDEAGPSCFVSDGAAMIRWIRERAFPDAIELLDWYHLAEQLRWAIGTDRLDRLETALGVAAPGDAERLAELLAGWAGPEADSDPERSHKLAAVRAYVLANRRAIENYAIVPWPPPGRWRRRSTSSSAFEDVEPAGHAAAGADLCVELVFEGAGQGAFEQAQAESQLFGWPTAAGRSSSGWVLRLSERHANGLLRRLSPDPPDRVVVHTGSLLAAHVEGLRRATPAGVAFEATREPVEA